jgi:PAS domain S-box-containing protein
MTTFAPSDDERASLNPAASAGKAFCYEWDVLSGHTAVSGDCLDVLGLTEGTYAAGTLIIPGIHTDDIGRLTATITRLTPEEPHAKVNFRIAHPDRGLGWVVMDGHAMFDTAGSLLRITGKVTDLSATRLTEIDPALANDWLRLTLAAGKSIGWDWDVRSGRDFWFGDLQTIFGIPANIQVGHVEEFRRRVHPDDRARVWKAVQSAMENRGPYAAEFRIVRPDGTLCWVAAQGKFSYLPNGEAERMLGIAVDVTARKNAEDALYRKDADLTEAQRLAGVGSWRWTVEDDTVSWSNEVYRITGRDPRLAAPTYAELSQIYTAESWERLRHAVEAALGTGTPYELELEVKRSDGTTRWIIGRGEAHRDVTGRVVGLHGTVQDITERRRSREALRESEERLRLAAEAGRMYAFEWDRATDMIVRSAEFTHILGLTTETKDTTCRQMLTNVHPDDQSKVVAATNSCTPENPFCRIKYRVLRSDGSLVWLEKNARAFFDAKGRMVRMIGMVADITERKLTEETLSTLSRRLIEAQETERARIARELHDDIGQRLALLSVTLEQLKQSAADSPKEVRGGMDEMRRQILAISAGIHALTHDLHSPTLRHLGIVKAMHGFCRELSEQQKVEIYFSHRDIPDSVPHEISLCLYRILQEGLHNAIKHSKVRQYQVSLRATSDSIHLTIEDSGLGFDPRAALAGNGLGLNSMQERLKLVNGELYIDSQPQFGTKVHARVPFRSKSMAARSGD